jgi:hypothetical protein
LYRAPSERSCCLVISNASQRHRNQWLRFHGIQRLQQKATSTSKRVPDHLKDGTIRIVHGKTSCANCPQFNKNPRAAICTLTVLPRRTSVEHRHSFVDFIEVRSRKESNPEINGEEPRTKSEEENEKKMRRSEQFQLVEESVVSSHTQAAML